MSTRTAGGNSQDAGEPAEPEPDHGATNGFDAETIGGPTSSSWREGALTRAAELEVLTDYFRLLPQESREVLASRIQRHVKTAREAAEGRPRRGLWFRAVATLAGSPHERAASNIDAAESDLLRIAPDEYVCGQMPSLLAHVRAHLPFNDPRRDRVEELAKLSRRKALSPVERNILVSAVRAANSEGRREVMRVRSFRNVLYLAATIMTVALIGLTVLALSRPDVVPLCFAPTGKVVCPTSETPIARGAPIDPVVRAQADPWDILTVEILGLIAAAVASAISLRNIRGTATPYSLPVALACLKLPTGALTAVLGLLLMRGNFVPGLSALDTPAQILSWAVIFGYAQQLFTRFADQRAHAVLDQVGAPSPGDPRLGGVRDHALSPPPLDPVDEEPEHDDARDVPATPPRPSVS
jgi:hypothetical protein